MRDELLTAIDDTNADRDRDLMLDAFRKVHEVLDDYEPEIAIRICTAALVLHGALDADEIINKHLKP